MRSQALRAGCTVEKKGTDSFYTLQKDGHPDLVFPPNRWGTYSMPISEFKSSFPELYPSAYAMDLTTPSQRLAYTRPQRDRADLVTHDHSRSLMHVSLGVLEATLRSNLFLNAPYRAKDVEHAADIHHACADCIKSKGTKPAAIGTYSAQTEFPGQYLSGDILYLCGLPYLLIADRLSKYKVFTSLKSKSAAQLLVDIRKVLGVWKGYRVQPKEFNMDREPALNAIASELWSEDHLKVVMTPPEAHEHYIERKIRTVKEYLLASCERAPCKLPRIAIEGLAFDTITLLNHVTTKDTYPESPKSLVCGDRLDLAKWRSFSAGDFGMFWR
jgi:hypothetical protein